MLGFIMCHAMVLLWCGLQDSMLQIPWRTWKQLELHVLPVYQKTQCRMSSLDICKSAVPEHRSNCDHHIQLLDTHIFPKPHYVDQIISQETEIELQPNNTKRDDGLILSRSWNLLIQPLRQQKRPPHGD
jgi:hypothetical protein